MQDKFNFINEIFRFVGTAKATDKEIVFKDRVIILFKAFLLVFAFSFLINLLFRNNSHSISESLVCLNNNKLAIILLLLLTPLHEEVMFRLFLTKFHAKYFIVSFSFILSFFAKILAEDLLYHNNLLCGILWDYSYYIIFAAFFYIILTAFKKSINKLEQTWNRYFVVFFYISSILFMLIHFNAEFYANYGILGIIKLLPIFMVGFFSGFIRINIGFSYSVFFHIIINTPSTFLIVLGNVL